MNLQEAKCYIWLDKWIESESSLHTILAKLIRSWGTGKGEMEEGRKTACFSTVLNPAQLQAVAGSFPFSFYTTSCVHAG